MSILGRIGNVAETLLGEELKRQEKQREEDELFRRQKALQDSGILNTMADKVIPLIAAGKKVDYSAFPEALQPVLRAAEAAAPSEQERTGALIGDIGKATKPEGVMSRPEVIAGLQGKGIDTSDQWDLTKQRQFSDAEGTFGNGEEGLLPAYTRGAYEENPLVTQATTAANSVRQRLQQGVEEESRRKMNEAAQTKLLPGRPETIGILHLDANGNPDKATVLGEDGSPRLATAEDMKNPDIKWQPERPTPPNYATLMASSTEPLDESAKRMYARQVALGGPLPTLYGMTGNKDKKDIANLAPLFDVTTGTWRDGYGGENVPDLTGNRISVGAAKGAIDQLTKNISAVGAFKKTADLNSELLKGVMKNIPSQNMPQFINSEVRDLASVFGDTAMSAFEIARQSVNAEYSRLIRQPNLTGVLTDDAANKLQVAMGPHATVNQVLAAIDILQKESTNRETGFIQQLEDTKRNIPGAGGNPKDTTTPTIPAHRPGVTRR